MKAADLPRQILYAPLADWLQQSPLPSIEALNAEATRRGLRNGCGLPLGFAPASGPEMGYETRLYHSGVAETRPDNWHDYFGALIWLAYPSAKAVINQLHFNALAAGGTRGPLRDGLTQFDECGLIVLCDDATLWDEILDHQWHQVFWRRRDELARHMRFLLFGHGSYDSLRAPFAGLCAKALCFMVDADDMNADANRLRQLADQRLADWLLASPGFSPRHLQPLPLLGIPGVVDANGEAGYYDDVRQFRPRPQVESRREVRQAIAVPQGIEESPGPIERDAG